MQLNKVPFVPNNESLLGILDKFQEGRSHMAIVSRFSVEKAKSVKKAVKRGLTQRLREKVGMSDGDSTESETDEEEEEESQSKSSKTRNRKDAEATSKSDGVREKDFATEGSSGDTKAEKEKSKSRKKSKRDGEDVEIGDVKGDEDAEKIQGRKTMFQMTNLNGREQSMPADAALTKESANEVG